MTPVKILQLTTRSWLSSLTVIKLLELGCSGRVAGESNVPADWFFVAWTDWFSSTYYIASLVTSWLEVRGRRCVNWGVTNLCSDTDEVQAEWISGLAISWYFVSPWNSPAIVAKMLWGRLDAACHSSPSSKFGGIYQPYSTSPPGLDWQKYCASCNWIWKMETETMHYVPETKLKWVHCYLT